jgi:putative ABC transport system substrate-binding protein
MTILRVTRREFVAALGGAAAWPVVARGQQPAKVWRVGYLSAASPNEAEVALFDAFKVKLQELGYVEGKNLRLDVRRADGDIGRLPTLATELVATAPNAIVCGGTATTAALQRATSSIPIVMAAAADPLGSGFIKSLAQTWRQHYGDGQLGRRSSRQVIGALARCCSEREAHLRLDVGRCKS